MDAMDVVKAVPVK